MAHLLVLKGPNRGQRLSLNRPRTVIGREPDCDVVLDAPQIGDRQKLAVSRKHAVISQIDSGYCIEDGDGYGRRSHNRTMVNGELVPFYPGRVKLKPEDTIKICDFAFVFHDEDTSSVIDAAISHDSSIYLTQPAERLKLLLEITNRLTNTLELDVLLPDVVETLLQLFKQADRAFLILVDEPTGALVPRSCKARRAGEEMPATFSASIVEECLAQVQGLCSNNVTEEFGSSDSIQTLSLRAAMCAPLWSPANKAFGVLLVDSRNDRKKFTEEDLNLLMGVANQASIALTNARFYRDSLARERLGRDIALAREVMRSFLPAQVPAIAGYEFFASNQSALEVGGDYYDFVPLPGGRLGVLVGDVSGKGISAALVMSRFSAEARTCLRTEADLAGAVRALNRLMQPLSQTDRFVTLAALVLDPARHTVHLVNAGHLPPLVLRRATGTLEEAASRDEQGLPLGVVDDYACAAHALALAPGDTVVVFSDGVIDAMNASGEALGCKKVCAAAQRGHAPPRALGERILQAVKEHAAGCSQHDDITLVCFGRTV
jgi:serine phosphatase RsbU (regulator of sigma subunit)/pSer/pThr/pTyr-binding forkhead associated (FHA) protein